MKYDYKKTIKKGIIALFITAGALFLNIPAEEFLNLLPEGILSSATAGLIVALVNWAKHNLKLPKI